MRFTWLIAALFALWTTITSVMAIAAESEKHITIEQPLSVLAQATTTAPGGQGLSCRYPGADSWRCQLVHSKNRIAVIYPEGKETGGIDYDAVIAGIQEQSHASVIRIPIRANWDDAQVAMAIERLGVHRIVALGRSGVSTVSAIKAENRNIEVVVGGVIWPSNADISANVVHTLAPDPSILFGILKHVMPQVRRVLVVFDPSRNAWLINNAREAAQNLELELVAYAATDIKKAVQSYQIILSTAEAQHDAIWLPQDATTVDDRLILPLVLKEAWGRNLVVFSSTAAHVRQGVLFSFVPDSRQLGRRLALSFTNLSSSSRSTIALLKDGQSLVNTRTARLLLIDPARLSSFDLTSQSQATAFMPAGSR